MPILLVLLSLAPAAAQQDTLRLSLDQAVALAREHHLGLSTVRQVLDSQDDLAQARLSRLQALVDYNRALIEWKRLTGEP